MDISKLVDYEVLHTLDILHFTTDEPVGIKMKIRSAGSSEAKKVLRSQTNKNLERRVRGKIPKSAQLEQEELEKAASYIESWDWGKNTYKDGVPELSMNKAVEILGDQGWIFGQVVEAANKIENFTPGSNKPSARKSSTP